MDLSQKKMLWGIDVQSLTSIIRLYWSEIISWGGNNIYTLFVDYWMSYKSQLPRITGIEMNSWQFQWNVTWAFLLILMNFLLEVVKTKKRILR